MAARRLGLIMLCLYDPWTRFVLIKAKVTHVTVDVARRLKYHILISETLKNPIRRYFHAIHTLPSTAACGVILTKGTEYLFMANIQRDGGLYIFSCDFFEPWEALSATQKNLLRRYKLGCDCKIKRCDSFPCGPSSPKECLWSDFLLQTSHGEQARNFACKKGKDGSCAWYRGLNVINSE
ncbi:metalloproteinase inhibitor 2-like isoform X2 [Corythoichthys intestinalis]|uniref:metalloproteinase inhibitor 2-like isoform X2 n=1 Tax=Corythoichthys intestinalis TaxID=161448 RepID=UPI0025A5CB33|nr:metalloproteinase inhibitor 2-like isoform X2 [Corythoichthys intestinalis]